MFINYELQLGHYGIDDHESYSVLRRSGGEGEVHRESDDEIWGGEAMEENHRNTREERETRFGFLWMKKKGPNPSNPSAPTHSSSPTN